MMQNSQSNLLTRDDTFFGVCEGLGEDLGINSNLLRLALAGMLFWSPPAAFGTYAVAGLIVLLSRLIAPNPRPGIAPHAAGASADSARAQTEIHVEAEPIPLAA